MSNFIDYVLTKTEDGKKGLYTANRWSHLAKGDLVLIEPGNAVEVMSSLTLHEETDDDVINFIQLMMETPEPQRLYGRVIIEKFEKEEEEE